MRIFVVYRNSFESELKIYLYGFAINNCHAKCLNIRCIFRIRDFLSIFRIFVMAVKKRNRERERERELNEIDCDSIGVHIINWLIRPNNYLYNDAVQFKIKRRNKNETKNRRTYSIPCSNWMQANCNKICEFRLTVSILVIFVRLFLFLNSILVFLFYFAGHIQPTYSREIFTILSLPQSALQWRPFSFITKFHFFLSLFFSRKLIVLCFATVCGDSFAFKWHYCGLFFRNSLAH